MKNFEEPRFSIDLEQDMKLDPFTHLVHSLRGFTCNASMLIAGYHHCHSSRVNYVENAVNLSNSEYAVAYYQYHAFLSDIIIRLRKACEPDKSSLAAGAISHLLNDPNLIEKLKEFITKSNLKIHPEFDCYISYIKNHCHELATINKNINSQSKPLLQKTALIRRLANKEIAHITLDSCKSTFDDLHDVFMAVSTIACAIQKILGDLACTTDLYTSEKMIFEHLYKGVRQENTQTYIPWIQNRLSHWVYSHNNE